MHGVVSALDVPHDEEWRWLGIGRSRGRADGIDPYCRPPNGSVLSEIWTPSTSSLDFAAHAHGTPSARGAPKTPSRHFASAGSAAQGRPTRCQRNIVLQSNRP